MFTGSHMVDLQRLILVSLLAHYSARTERSFLETLCDAATKEVRLKGDVSVT